MPKKCKNCSRIITDNREFCLRHEDKTPQNPSPVSISNELGPYDTDVEPAK